MSAAHFERALARTDPNSPTALEDDARELARCLLKHWGDDAPRVAAKALELARVVLERRR